MVVFVPCYPRQSRPCDYLETLALQALAVCGSFFEEPKQYTRLKSVCRFWARIVSRWNTVQTCLDMILGHPIFHFKNLLWIFEAVPFFLHSGSLDPRGEGCYRVNWHISFKRCYMTCHAVWDKYWSVHVIFGTSDTRLLLLKGICASPPWPALDNNWLILTYTHFYRTSPAEVIRCPKTHHLQKRVFDSAVCMVLLFTLLFIVLSCSFILLLALR